MNRPSRSRALTLFTVILLLATSGRRAGGQTLTGGGLSGSIVDQQGGALPGVSVTAVHEPTGTAYEAITDSEGRFQVPNLRVGPYRVTATLSGFSDVVQSDVTVLLGETRNLSLTMGLAAVTEVVNVTAPTTFSDTRAGTADTITRSALQQLPSLSRNLTDFARLSPHFNQTNQNGADSFLSIAGRNNRYNGILIDGAANNDVFGLSDSGTPGGQTGAQPISLDALDELQLVVAPYDVRQGGFSGGGINAVTKSGTNTLSGTGYIFGRNESLVGDLPSQTDPSAPSTSAGKFKETQLGASVGGPLVRNAAFFFTNLDFARKDTPSGFSISGGTGQDFGHQVEAQRFLDILQDVYGYSPGGPGLAEFTKRNNSDKVFFRTDFNLPRNQRLTVRHNYVGSVADIGFPSATQYNFADNFWQFENTTNSTVLQLYSVFGSAYNEARITVQTFNDRRTGQPGQQPFPFVRVDLPDGTNLRAGTENFSVANELDQRVIEVHDDFTWLVGDHTLTIGSHNEFLKFRNLFIRDFWGNYRFNGLDNFAAGIAGGFDYSFSNTADPREAARFAVRQFGFYVGDQWRARPNLTVTYGFRVDLPVFPDKPGSNPMALANFGYATDVAPSPAMYSPRAGFNWDLSSERRQRQLRGGLGLFTGRTPYVWLSNQYVNTGLNFPRLIVNYNANNRVPFVPDVNDQPRNLGGAATNEIDVIDPDYKFPSVLRGNVAYDHSLGFMGLIGSGEVLFSKNVQDIAYSNLNYVVAGTIGADGRPRYARKVSSLNDVILLSNTSQGSQWSVSYSVTRQFKNGFFFNGSYLYNDARSITDGSSSQAASNWGNVYIGASDVNAPPLTRSIYAVGSMVKFSATVPISLGRGISSYASFYYNGQSGRPYVLVFNGDVNGDGRFTNDILYVPANASEITVANGSYDQLLAYLNADDSTRDLSGAVPERNAGRSPWTNTLDFRYAVLLPTGGRTKVELTMDVLNLLNLFDSSNGWSLYPNFNGPTVVNGSFDAATGKMVYNLSPLNSPTFATYGRDNLRSRWQAQWGLRVRF
ncbi:MAG: carboxypeptidase regulatory-like domain-containing protein [Vicinamibacterales bacterium]